MTAFSDFQKSIIELHAAGVIDSFAAATDMLSELENTVRREPLQDEIPDQVDFLEAKNRLHPQKFSGFDMLVPMMHNGI